MSREEIYSDVSVKHEIYSDVSVKHEVYSDVSVKHEIYSDVSVKHEIYSDVSVKHEIYSDVSVKHEKPVLCLGSSVLIEIGGFSLASYKFNACHPDVFNTYINIQWCVGQQT